MSDPLRRWVIFATASLAVLLLLILFVQLTGPKLSDVSPKAPLEEEKSESPMVIELPIRPAKTPLDFALKSPDAVLVWRELSEPWQTLGIIDNRWRVKPSFRAANEASLAQIESQWRLDFNRGLTWLEQKLLPMGPIYLFAYDLEHSPWYALVFSHAVPNILRGNVAKMASSNGREAKFSQLEDKTTMSVIDEQVALCGKDGHFIAVFANQAGRAEAKIAEMLASDKKTFKQEISEAHVKGLESPVSAVYVHLPQAGLLGKSFSTVSGAAGAVDLMFNVSSKGITLNVKTPMSQPTWWDSKMPINRPPLDSNWLASLSLPLSPSGIDTSWNDRLSALDAFFGINVKNDVLSTIESPIGAQFYPGKFKSEIPIELALSIPVSSDELGLGIVDRSLSHLQNVGVQTKPLSIEDGIMHRFHSGVPAAIGMVNQRLNLSIGSTAIESRSITRQAARSTNDNAALAIFRLKNIWKWAAPAIEEKLNQWFKPVDSEAIEGLMSSLFVHNTDLWFDLGWSEKMVNAKLRQRYNADQLPYQVANKWAPPLFKVWDRRDSIMSAAQLNWHLREVYDVIPQIQLAMYQYMSKGAEPFQISAWPMGSLGSASKTWGLGSSDYQKLGFQLRGSLWCSYSVETTKKRGFRVVALCDLDEDGNNARFESDSSGGSVQRISSAHVY